MAHSIGLSRYFLFSQIGISSLTCLFISAIIAPNFEALEGYLKDKEETDKSMAEGWFHSGDLAVIHPNGYIQIKDRSKDIIISGGENVSSVEIENTLYKHPSVLFAAVVAKPDPKWGETPCAFIELKDLNDKITETEIIDFCKKTLAGFKCPKKIIFTELPKTSTGKILKYELRETAKNS